VIEFHAGRLVLIAVVVYVVWRVVCWRRKGGDPMREAVAAVLFGWSLFVASLTFFPMVIIFYDWHGSFSLIPLQSTLDLLRHAPQDFARRNIGGNLLVFVPFGVLLPLLFEKLRRPWALAWRVGAISVAIEVGQMFTRVRATDVDDVILNVLGALAGLGLFRVAWAIARRNAREPALAARVASPSRREPLLIGAVPVAVITALLVASLVPPLMDATLSEKEALAGATSGLDAGVVAARADTGGHLFVLASSGATGADQVSFTTFRRVLPGRYTRTQWGKPFVRRGSFFWWGFTTYDVLHEDGPVAFVFGRNEAGATTLVVHDDGRGTAQESSIGEYFVVAFPYDAKADMRDDGILNDLRYTFVDAAGRDVTARFRTE
jgi:glycopeptide antibiotics resistance protein